MVTYMFVSNVWKILELDPPNKQIITFIKGYNIKKRQLRRSSSLAAGVFVLGLKLTKSKLDIVIIIENNYNVNN